MPQESLTLPTFQFTRLTAPGRGAIATLLVEGAGAREAIAAHFRFPSGRSLRRWPIGRVQFGRFGPEPAEEVVLCRCGEQVIELSCHGGLAAVEIVTRLLAAKGGREMPWRDVVRNEEPDPLVAEARLALAEAPTERTAAILLDQYHGSLRRAIVAVREALAAGRAEDARRALERLANRAELGRHLCRPWQVVVAGRPNVGKSSLINAILGYGRAIVHHVPGTTRDVVTARTAMEGWPVELADTAGLRESDDELERAGIRLARQRLAAADLVLLVSDVTQSWRDADAAMLAERPDAILVHSKCDLAPVADRSRPPGLRTSAARGEGLAELVGAIAGRLVPAPPEPGEAVPVNERQIAAVLAAQQILKQGDTAGTRDALERLLRGG